MKGQPSNRWPAKFTDDAGKEIKSAEEIDWTGFNTMEGYQAEIRFNAKVEEGFINALRRKP